MKLNIYLSGEIHTNWREEIMQGCDSEKLTVSFSAPVTNHDASDDCGVAILGAEDKKFWHDNKGAKMNAIRTRKGIEDADVVVVRFGEKYKQWNAAFDAGYASALGGLLHGSTCLGISVIFSGASNGRCPTNSMIPVATKYPKPSTVSRTGPLTMKIFGDVVT